MTDPKTADQRSNDPRDWCDVCLGTGLPQPGTSCICGGAGTGGAEKVGLRREVIRCRDEIERLRAAMRDILKGEGAYNLDQYTFACNVIENMKDIASKTLAGTYD